MATFGRRKRGEIEERGERTPHPTPEFWVTEIGWDYEWAWCPICGAKPDGWYDDGTLRWSGGTIDCAVPDRRSGELVERVAACRCAAGQALHRGARALEFFDRLPPATEFLTRPFAVLWRRYVSIGHAPAEQERPGSAKYNEAMAVQFRRQMRGEITREQFLENAKTLEKKFMPERTAAPTVLDILQSAALMKLYYPTAKTDEASPEAQHDGRALAAGD